MTVTTSGPQTPATAPSDGVTLSVDGIEITVPKGTLVIRAAEQLGVAVPRFCDHPLLDPVAACRMCLVEIEGQPKPQPACAVTAAEGMKVRTQVTSEVAERAQQGVMEFLLINHPLDCPICDKGGECPLQNQAMSNGRSETRFDAVKRTFPKPINVSAQILLDRERCVSCARCTRFADQIAGDPFIDLLERGAQQQVGTSSDTPFDSYFSGNTVQICPVGALTSAKYRFRARPFDLVSTPTVCEHCASGCGLRTDVRRSAVMRRLAWDEPAVNEEWNCDKGRFAFVHQTEGRLEHPLVRDTDGSMVAASWPEAISIAAAGLRAAGPRTAVLTGGRLTLEDSYAYAKFARAVLGTDDVDFRARPGSAEETAFLAALVAGRPLGPTYADLESAPAVVLAGLDPEDESPMVFLRLRKGARTRNVRVFSVASFASTGVTKARGTLLATVPGAEAATLDALADDTADGDLGEAARLLREPGAVLLVGERLAVSAGALSAAARLAAATGARLGWVPRRAGERGALDAGALAGLLPGGRPLAAPAARAAAASVWGVAEDSLPAEAGRDLPAVLAALHAEAAAVAAADDPDTVERSVGALLVAGVEAADLADPEAFLGALDAAPFVVSLEQRHSAVTERADVVLPVASVDEKSGTFVDWEGRPRPFAQVLRAALTLSDARVLAMLADEAGAASFGPGDVASLRAELAAFGPWDGERAEAPSVAAAAPAAPGEGEAVLATWRQLLDRGVLQEGDPYLLATARPAVARLSPATAAAIGAVDGGEVVVSTDSGFTRLPLVVTAMPDGVVWLPANSDGSTPRATLAAGHGDIVRISGGAA
ncbi:MAG: NADH-quinone oxidoreductase subunit G [Frankiales bacterium]|nr:NADH-quinone oxidoreductase subunit G [Frankiales bacterium]